MSSFKTLPVFFSLFIITFGSTYTSNIEIRNNCPYTVWAAAVPSGGGRKLNRGETWALNVNPGTEEAHIWARTKCNFDNSGRGTCETGDCGGVLECKSFGQPPNTVAEYMSVKQDVFDISLLNGFNVPMEFSPTSNGCSSGIKCTADIIGQCPKQLKTPGGCHNPCTFFKTDKYCCSSGRCGLTDLSKLFKERCKDDYTFPKDDKTRIFTCPQRTNYRVVFCP
ncbi:protein P21 [Ziziphus jujuba]|uniref:Protein P21 n=1 Tax=Ziziphus jujuba TaxID=326968 RepID=A0ABM3I325_ZIZJJ|nr:protein P21 [Ziziphus jujuba]